jgi:Leucine-rich repeat (LRR) protein
MGMVLFR